MSTKNARKILQHVSCAVFIGLGVIPQVVQAEETSFPPLSLSQARLLAQAAEKKAASNQTSIVVTVVDPSGQPILVERMAGAQLASIDLSQRKAVSAVFYKRPSATFEAALSGGKMAVLALPHAMPAGGGSLFSVRPSLWAASVSVEATMPRTPMPPMLRWDL